jgi:hypothetical protein
MTINEIEDVTGAGTLLSAFVLNLYEMITGTTVNGWLTVCMSLGGIIYLGWKIVTQRKDSKLRDLEIEKAELEIKKLKEKK